MSDCQIHWGIKTPGWVIMDCVSPFPPIAEVAPGKNCALAYTLNNRQPVRCTLVGDQPLFFLDNDISAEEEGLLDTLLSSTSAVAGDYNRLQGSHQAFDQLSKEFFYTDEQKLDMFAQNAKGISRRNTEITDVEALIAPMRHSRLAETYLADLEAAGVKFVPTAGIRLAGFDKKTKTIHFNPTLGEDTARFLLCREIRRAWLSVKGAWQSPFSFHPDQAVLLNRVQNADLAITQVRIAWEMQLAGEKALWAMVENGSLADMGQAFGREASIDFRGLNNGSSAIAAFETWFLSERCRRADRMLIQQMLSAYQSYVGTEHPQVARILGQELVAAVGSMPYGKNYLSGHTSLILSDPIFTEVRDRSNANFLWFIKFERAFSEAEQELQEEVSASANSKPSFRIHDSARDNTTGNLVQLFPAREEATDRRAKPAE